MQALVERIRAEGVNLGNGILKVDSMLNHQLDPQLMMGIGKSIAAKFKDVQIDRILTAEISGIGPALMAATQFNVPVVYARKKKPITMAGPVFLETAPSHTKGGDTLLLVSAEFLNAGERVLIIDDFLASGKTLMALARIVKSARAELVGVGVVVEKSFEGGREMLHEQYPDIPVHALAVISSMEGTSITVDDSVD